MDREKLKEKRNWIGSWIGEASVQPIKRALLEIIDALLEDDKPKIGIEEEREACKLKSSIRTPAKETKHDRFFQDWTPEEIKAIEESIIHWRDNVSRLKLADHMGMEIIKHSFLEQWIDAGARRAIAFFNAGHCPLCMSYRGDNYSDCPLFRSGGWCKPEGSAWGECKIAEGNKEIIEAAENMVSVLEGLLE